MKLIMQEKSNPNQQNLKRPTWITTFLNICTLKWLSKIYKLLFKTNELISFTTVKWEQNLSIKPDQNFLERAYRRLQQSASCSLTIWGNMDFFRWLPEGYMTGLSACVTTLDYKGLNVYSQNVFWLFWYTLLVRCSFFLQYCLNYSSHRFSKLLETEYIFIIHCSIAALLSPGFF